MMLVGLSLEFYMEIILWPLYDIDPNDPSLEVYTDAHMFHNDDISVLPACCIRQKSPIN